MKSGSCSFEMDMLVMDWSWSAFIRNCLLPFSLCWLKTHREKWPQQMTLGFLLLLHSDLLGVLERAAPEGAQ